MIEVVLDASVVIKWFRSDGERNVEAAREIRAVFEAGDMLVFAPPLLPLEILNVAGRRWNWQAGPLGELATSLDGIGFDLTQPELTLVARWTALGLTAYDATYVALAEQTSSKLITDDRLIQEIAPQIAEPLTGG